MKSAAQEIDEEGEKHVKAYVDYRTYCYFAPYGDIDMCVNGCFIPLRLDHYGFPENRTVKIIQSNDFPFLLSQRSKELIEHLFSNNAVPLTEGLEILSKAINDSMRYDVPRSVATMRRSAKLLKKVGFPDERTDMVIRKYRDMVCRKGYRPVGDETRSVICVDAGRYIRQMIGMIFDDEHLRYHAESTSWVSDDVIEGVGGHDVTVVFDIKTKDWAVVNSKSPIKLYNVVPKDKLHELGSPFTGV